MHDIIPSCIFLLDFQYTSPLIITVKRTIETGQTSCSWKAALTMQPRLASAGVVVSIAPWAGQGFPMAVFHLQKFSSGT